MKKVSKFLVPLLLGAMIVASIIWYLFIYDRNFTRDTLLSQARFHDTNGNSRISAWFYDAAYGFSGHDESVAIELANQYKQDENFTKAELTLTNAINNNPTAELYTALCKTFVEQDKLLDAVKLLQSVQDPVIKAELDALRPSAPESDIEAGYYSQYMDIHLESKNAKYIFYTLDQEYPSISGLLYQNAISLPAGETILSAVAVSENGLVSPVTQMGFTITGVIEEAVFVDATMEAAIRELIGADSDDKIYTNQLWDITEFTAPEGVVDYSDLSLLPYLTKLTIQNQDIFGLSALSSLNKLTVLDLTGSRFPAEDMQVLAGLPSLTSLNMSGCSLSTIDNLEGAANLTSLDLSNNNIRHLDVLAPMTGLVELYLQHNAISTLEPLKDLQNLTTLTISYNPITSLSPIGNCFRLSHLEADNAQLSNLNGVEKLPMLTHLSVDYNNLTDVSILSGSTELTNLSIASNAITDISSLSTLTKLQIFDFSSNQVAALPNWPDGCSLTTIDGSYNTLASIDNLKNMQSLTHVYMDYNLLTNIDALADCFCLVQVNVYGNAIPNVDALRDHDIIVNYNPTVQ